jgi:hypothetical protein
MLKRLALTIEDEGGGLGKYAANEFRLAILANAAEAITAVYEPCLALLEQAIELASPVSMGMTEKGLITGYGPRLESGDIFIAAASPSHALTLGVKRPNLNRDLPDWSDMPPTEFWRLICETVEDANAAIKLRQDFTHQKNILVTTLFIKMGAARLSTLARLAKESRKRRSSLIPAVVAVAACTGDSAGGGLITLLLPRTIITEDAA